MFKSLAICLYMTFFTPVIAGILDESTPPHSQDRLVKDQGGMGEVASFAKRNKKLLSYLNSTSKAPSADTSLLKYVLASVVSFSNTKDKEFHFYETVFAKLILEGNIPKLRKSKAIKQLNKLSSHYCSAAYLLGEYYEGQLLNCNKRLLHTSRRYYLKAKELGSKLASSKIKIIDKILVNQAGLKKTSSHPSDIEYNKALQKNWEFLSNKYRALLNNKLPKQSLAALRAEALKGDEVAIGFWLCYFADHPEIGTQVNITKVSKAFLVSLIKLLEIESNVPYISYIIGRLHQKKLIRGKDPIDAKPYLERAGFFGYEPALLALVEYLETYEKDEEGTGKLQENYLQLAINKNFVPAILKRAQLLESKYRWSNSKSEQRLIRLAYQKAARLNCPNATLRLAQLRHRARKNPMQLYLKAGKLGSAEAQYYLGLVYMEGLCVSKSKARAKYWLEKAAAQGHKRSLYYLGELMFKEYNDIELAIKYYKQAVDYNLLQAKYSLAQHYIYGIGVSQDKSAGIELLSEAANEGHVEARKLLYKTQYGAKATSRNIDLLTDLAKWGCSESQFELAWCYYNGVGVKKDDNVSLGWLERAATLKHPGAMYELGWKYHKGVVVAKNPERATLWFIKAAECRHVGAMYTLAQRYAHGDGLEMPDNYMATRWFKRAAERGHTRAMYHLAYRYVAGEGVKKDVQRALELFLVCLKKGYFPAIYPLWELCIVYEDELKHNSEIVAWLKESAESNSSISQCFLADLYFRGAFLQQDIEKAIHWYDKSSRLKNTIAQTRLGDIYNYLHRRENKSMRFYEIAARRGSHLAQHRLSLHFNGISIVHKVNTLTRFMPQIDGTKQFVQNLKPFKPGRIKFKRWG